MNRIKVLLVDDHAVMRMGLVSLLKKCPELSVVGDSGEGAEASALVSELKPDVVIMDLQMPGMDGIAATREIIENSELRIENSTVRPRILILTTFGTSDGISRAIEVGASGAILKSADLSELREAIAAVARGEKYISDEIAQIMSDTPPIKGLSERQLEILESMTRGLSNEDIAHQLHIALPTVKDHVKRLCEQLGAANRTEAVSIALSRHLIRI